MEGPRVMAVLLLAAVLGCGGASAAVAAPTPAATVTPRTQPKGKIKLPAKLGVVTFDHEQHVKELKVACATCHHPSRPAKANAAEHQACRDCHTLPATPPVKTSLRAAFHDPKAGTGTCIDCHRKAAAQGQKAPLKCMECHKK